MAVFIPLWNTIGGHMKLTQKHFDLFRNECERWRKHLGLISWTVDYEFDDLKEAYADCLAHYSGRRATIRLNNNFPKKLSEIDLGDIIRQCALHEVLEMLLSPMVVLASDRSYDDTDYQKETHCVIRTLENILL